VETPTESSSQMLTDLRTMRREWAIQNAYWFQGVNSPVNETYFENNPPGFAPHPSQRITVCPYPVLDAGSGEISGSTDLCPDGCQCPAIPRTAYTLSDSTCPNDQDEQANGWKPSNGCTNSTSQTSWSGMCVGSGDNFGGQSPPARGTAMSTQRVFQYSDWSTHPSGGRPPDWEVYALLYDDAVTYTFPTSGMSTQDENTVVKPRSRNRVSRSPTNWAPNNTAGSTFYLGTSVLEMVVAYVHNEGTFICNATDATNIFMYEVINASPEPLAFVRGNVAMDGVTHFGPGPIDVTTPGIIKFADVTNHANVNFYNSRVYLLAATNKAGATITFSQATGRAYNATNQGTLSLTGGTVDLLEAVNEAGGLIRCTDVTATLENVTNRQGGGIEVNGGSYIFTGSNLLNEAGASITVGGASSGRRLQAASSTTATIRGGVNLGNVVINSGTIDITLDYSTGSITIASGVVGSVALGTGSTTTLAGAGASSITVSTFVSTSPLAASYGGGGGGGGGTDSGSSSDNTGGMIGGIIGGCSGSLFGIIGYAAWKKKKQGEKKAQV